MGVGGDGYRGGGAAAGGEQGEEYEGGCFHSRGFIWMERGVQVVGISKSALFWNDPFEPN